MSILQVDNVSLRYSLYEGYAVRYADFEVYEGEILALVGESGSGKTTLLRLMAGFEEPDEGRIFIGGNCVAEAHRSLPPEKRSVGIVFQGYALFPHLTVFDNIAYGLHYLGRKARKQRVEEMLALVSLQTFRKKYPYELSGGQQIGRAHV